MNQDLARIEQRSHGIFSFSRRRNMVEQKELLEKALKVHLGLFAWADCDETCRAMINSEVEG